MKKHFTFHVSPFTYYVSLFTLFLLTFHLSLFTGTAHAAGSVSSSIAANGFNEVQVWTLTFTADASDGSIPSTTMTASELKNVHGYYLYQIVTNPGSTAPTDNWDVVVLNSDGVADVLGSQCLNRDTANSETCYPVNYYLVDDALTVAISGNSVNSATATVKIFFVK